MKRPMRVVGLDLSLNSTGMSDGEHTQVVQTGTGTCLEERLDRIVRGVMTFVVPNPLSGPDPDLVVIEGASYGSKGRGVEQLSALRLMVRHRLWCLQIPFALVTPATLKKYTTGSGGASKPDMVTAVDARHGTDFASVKLAHGRYDRADALALAAMGLDHVGQPMAIDLSFGSMPKRSALDSVTWPELVSDE